MRVGVVGTTMEPGRRWMFGSGCAGSAAFGGNDQRSDALGIGSAAADVRMTYLHGQ